LSSLAGASRPDHTMISDPMKAFSLHPLAHMPDRALQTHRGWFRAFDQYIIQTGIKTPTAMPWPQGIPFEFMPVAPKPKLSY